VTANHLQARVIDEPFNAPPPAALPDDHQKERGIQQITQLFAEVRSAAAFRGLEHLPGFLEEVRQQRVDRLRAIPGAAAG